MNSKKTLVGLVALFAVLNAGILFAANEPIKTFYSGFGTEDPDPDLDRVYSNEDQCPGSPFDLTLLSKSTKKNPSSTSFTNPTDSSKQVYLKLKSVSNNGAITVSTSANEGFSSSKSFTVDGKMTLVDSVGKRMRVMYANESKGIAILWVSGREGSKKGCTMDELRASAGEEELTPP